MREKTAALVDEGQNHKDDLDLDMDYKDYYTYHSLDMDVIPIALVVVVQVVPFPGLVMDYLYCEFLEDTGSIAFHVDIIVADEDFVDCAHTAACILDHTVDYIVEIPGDQ